MRNRIVGSLVSLGAALVAASSVQAQPVAGVLVCRDGAQIVARSTRACAGRGGVDARATTYARQRAQGAYNQGAYNQGAYNQGAYNQGAYNQGRYANHGQAVSAQRHAEHDARRDDRQRDDRRRDDRQRDDRRPDDRRHDDRDRG